MNLLLVEDDIGIGGFLSRGLRAAGYAVDWTEFGREGLDKAEAHSYGVIILDLMLPDIDGIEVCRALRRRNDAPPILILSARDSVEQRVHGLDAGGDDYLVKPFAFDELLARLRSLQRRKPAFQGVFEARLAVADLLLDREAHRVSVAGEVVELSVREFRLLEFFMKNANKALTRPSILANVWGIEADVTDNTVDVYVGYLRRKIEKFRNVPRIETIRGIGFKLAGPRPA